MQNQPENQPKDNTPRPRIRLPFEQKASDPGEWSYDHRAGISVTLITFLLFAIVFVAGKISVGGEKGQGAILVEFPEEPRARLTPEQVEMLRQQMAEDYSSVANRTSNENAELNANLRDDRGTQASDLYDEAGALDEKMRANKAAYEAGLAREQAMRDAQNRPKTDSQGDSRDTKVQGRVTVSFSFSNPTRTSQKLVVPAYMCEGGGQVTVLATLDNNGYVTNATVERGLSTSDNCMQETAVKAARGSRLNLDTSAPAKHQGTITYVFIPQ